MSSQSIAINVLPFVHPPTHGPYGGIRIVIYRPCNTRGREKCQPHLTAITLTSDGIHLGVRPVMTDVEDAYRNDHRLNSRPLDVHRWGDHPEVRQLIDQLWGGFVEAYPEHVAVFNFFANK